MRIFKNRLFHQWTRKAGLDDKTVRNAIEELERGIHNASLGGNLYKKRIGIKGRGKSGGIRTIIAYKKENKAFCMYGYSKNARSNINKKELAALVKIAKIYFSYEDLQINEAIKTGKFVEVL